MEPFQASLAWSWPLQGELEIVRPFDKPAQNWLAGHRGVDVAAAVGQEILAPAAGTVSFNGVVVDRHLIVIDHGDLRTTLEPVLGTVSVGEHVSPKHVVGTVTDEEPDHCGEQTCLHWGVRQGNDYIDPLSLIRPRAVLLE